MTTKTENVNVAGLEPFPTPRQVKERQPAPSTVRHAVAEARRGVSAILARRDHRLLVVIGPCSIHDPMAALDYARRLKALARQTEDTLMVVMRAYFEKPRTTVGWKGLINDPDINDTFDVVRGIRTARQVLLDIADLGLPLATEALDPITPQYLQDLMTWSAIGARTTESQTHRELASGLSSAVGFKNGTDGSLAVAVNALKSAANPHRFLGIDSDGRVAVVHTRGNSAAHIVLRGGEGGPNYDAKTIARCESALSDAGLSENIMVDCSHANSNKNHERQRLVADAVVDQIVDGNRSIMGLMVESNIAGGNQSPLAAELAYGVSITDACLGWDATEDMLLSIARRLREPLPARLAMPAAS